MRHDGSVLFAFAAASALLSSGGMLPFPALVSAKGGRGGGGRGGGRPSGGFGGFRPSRPSPSKPSTPTFSRPTPPARPTFKSPTGPLTPTARSTWNPNPSFKPLSPSGAPTVRSGGGGFGSKAKHFAAGAAVGVVATVGAGYFFYGGRHSGPYCRGNDENRFMSGRCPRGTSSTAHTCKTNIPLCPIPEAVRNKWNVGKDAPPKVDVAFDNSICSVVNAIKTTAPEAVTNSTSNSTVAGIVGQSGLDACVRSVVAAGGCSSHSAGDLFFYDEDVATCGCCSSAQVIPIKNSSSAVYTYSPADLTEAPKHCISGSTMYFPVVAGGPDKAQKCECGTCALCGAGASRFVDWSGPYVVPDAVGSTSFADAKKTLPEYDPVGTCLCNDATAGLCDGQSAAIAVGSHSSNLMVLSSAVVFLLHFL